MLVSLFQHLFALLVLVTQSRGACSYLVWETTYTYPYLAQRRAAFIYQYFRTRHESFFVFTFDALFTNYFISVILSYTLPFLIVGGSITKFSISFHPLQFISIPWFTEMLKISTPLNHCQSLQNQLKTGKRKSSLY